MFVSSTGGPAAASDTVVEPGAGRAGAVGVNAFIAVVDLLAPNAPETRWPGTVETFDVGVCGGVHIPPLEGGPAQAGTVMAWLATNAPETTAIVRSLFARLKARRQRPVMLPTTDPSVSMLDGWPELR
jgi:hypothetical protein